MTYTRTRWQRIVDAITEDAESMFVTLLALTIMVAAVAYVGFIVVGWTTK